MLLTTAESNLELLKAVHPYMDLECVSPNEGKHRYFQLEEV